MNDMIVLKKLEIAMKPEDLRALKLIEEAWKDIEEDSTGSIQRRLSSKSSRNGSNKIHRTHC